MLHSEIEFLRAIARDPDDDTVRLVFADWLGENGDDVWASLIRTQVADPERTFTVSDPRPIQKFLPDRPRGLENVVTYRWCRGAVEWILIPHDDWFGVAGREKLGPGILAAVPTIRYVRFSDRDPKNGAPWSSPMWARYPDGYSGEWQPDDVTGQVFSLLLTRPDAVYRSSMWVHFGQPGGDGETAHDALSWAALEWAKREIKKGDS